DYALSVPRMPMSLGISELKKIVKCIFLLLSTLSIKRKNPAGTINLIWLNFKKLVLHYRAHDGS
ncbi:MAG TPA: hypothetical protein VE619_07160, partial [Nitrososphaeraceae archaeon]|nr:hypothetical protein [Nitrososphaeraceae archaeon]